MCLGQKTDNKRQIESEAVFCRDHYVLRQKIDKNETEDFFGFHPKF